MIVKIWMFLFLPFLTESFHKRCFNMMKPENPGENRRQKPLWTFDEASRTLLVTSQEALDYWSLANFWTDGEDAPTMELADLVDLEDFCQEEQEEWVPVSPEEWEAAEQSGCEHLPFQYRPGPRSETCTPTYDEHDGEELPPLDATTEDLAFLPPWQKVLDRAENLVIGSGITRVCNFAFYGHTGITQVWIPDTVTSIEAGAFMDCTGITRVRMPSKLRQIGERAFQNCTSLTEITLPDTLLDVELNAFAGCTGLERIAVDRDNQLYASDDQGLLYNKDMTWVLRAPGAVETCTLPEGVEGVSQGAFQDCVRLRTVCFPRTMRFLGESTVEHDSDGAWPDGVFQGCTALDQVELPEGLEVVGDFAFDGCTGLTHISLPASLRFVGHCAFRKCVSLTGAALQDSVQAVGYYAFAGCTAQAGTGLAATVLDVQFRVEVPLLP